jgi:hypothetical protein
MRMVERVRSDKGTERCGKVVMDVSTIKNNDCCYL